MSEGVRIEDFQRKFEGVAEDLILLEDTTDESITDVLDKRYKEGQYYTYLGSQIVAVNPYSDKKKKIYNNESKHIYHTHNPYELQPHLFSLAEATFRAMKETGKPQSVIISGESGSGKTVSARIILDYFAQVSESGGAKDYISKVMINSNPILEAFGNAKTLRNDNSSRFGKHMELFFNFKGQLEGGYITSSLLEKSRVCYQRQGERNFHIFYQLCTGAPEDMKVPFGITTAKQFSYLNKTETSIPGIKDREGFKQTQECLGEAGILFNEQVEIFKIVAGVLHLGNIRFIKNPQDKTEKAIVSTPDVVKMAASNLGCKEADLEYAILNRKIKIGYKDEINIMAQNPEQAAKNRDALAKDIYERLFHWLIKRINAAIKKPDNAKYAIGVLDIYGFEIYEGKENSLEQLNINYVNEKIQQLVQKWLTKELEEYIAEGVTAPTNIKIKSSTECLRLIDEKPTCIYSLLDEESLLRGGGNDKNYVGKLHNNFDRERFKGVYTKDRFEPLMWHCNHFAGKVPYYCEGWIEKNNDTVYEDLIKMMQSSESLHVQALYPKGEKIQESGKLQKTTSMKFQQDVATLTGKIKGREQHYIRCLKPNHEKKAELFKFDQVKDQVKYLGITENVAIAKAGFFFKMPYEKFVEKYKLCGKKTFPIWRGPSKDGTEVILKDMGIHKFAAYGKTKIFLKSPSHLAELDEKIESRKSEMAALIQTQYRKYKQKKMVLETNSLGVALEQTYGDHSTIVFKQTLNQITQVGERQRQMLTLTEKALYVLDPASFTVKRRIQFDRIEGLFCSCMSDGVFGFFMKQDICTLFEADNKHEVMEQIREQWAKTLYPTKEEDKESGKKLAKEIGETFKYTPKRGLVQEVRYRKNFNAKNTLIEYTPDGLTISIRPSEDIFDGAKARRRGSYSKVYYGDYLHLQKSLVVQGLREKNGDENVAFSSSVSKYNKKYKSQERILLIMDKHFYNMEPNGYMVSKTVALSKIKSISVSPLTDGFFIIHTEKQDFIYETNKKTECLKLFAEQYANATRRTLRFNVKSNINWKKKGSNADHEVRFKEKKDIPATILIPDGKDADVHVRPEEIMNNNLSSELIQDIYGGQKLRRRDSLLRWHLGDYLHVQNSKVMNKLTKQYKDQKILYSGIVAKVNKRYTVQNRKMLITEKAIYNMDADGMNINRRIPIEKIESLHCSAMRDGFFIIRVPDEYDYFHTSSQKTEIMKVLQDQYKKITGKTLPIQVDNNIVYSAAKKSQNKGVRTIEFKEDSEVLVPTIYPTTTGVKIKINNDEVVRESKESKDIGIQDKPNSVYSGRKYRRKNSIGREFLGDYLRLENNAQMKQLMKKNGDNQLLFSAEVTKINNKYKGQNRILVVTDQNVYNIDSDGFKVKRRIKLDEIDGVSVSSLTDGHFCLHVPNEYDYLFESDKKTEILDVLGDVFRHKDKNLKVNVADKFEYNPNGEITSVNFVLDENTDNSFLESGNGGLTVHVKHEEPEVVLEAAYIHVKDQPKPIEVKSQPILIKLRKRWKYKLEIRFYCNAHLEGCTFVERIETVSSREEHVSKVSNLEAREERYVITLPERTVLFSILSKTKVKAKLVDASGKSLMAIRFIYDCK
jgi:myosin-1